MTTQRIEGYGVPQEALDAAGFEQQLATRHQIEVYKLARDLARRFLQEKMRRDLAQDLGTFNG